MKHLEHDAQCAVIRWADMQSSKYPALKNLFGVPNAGRRSPRQGKWLKDEGLRAGVPDLFLAYPVGMHNGLFIEMKAQGNKQTTLQKDWEFRLCKAGYMTAVCYSAEAAIIVIKNYLGIK